MTNFLLQISILSTIAVLAGAVIGWWLHIFYGNNDAEEASNRDLDAVKGYLAESVKENARLKLQLKQSEEKIETLTQEDIPGLSGVDFEAYKAFENTIKEANLRKYLS